MSLSRLAFLSFALALFPALVAVVSIYGMLVSPTEVAHQVDSITRAMPPEARQLVVTQLQTVTAKSRGGGAPPCVATN